MELVELIVESRPDLYTVEDDRVCMTNEGTRLATWIVTTSNKFGIDWDDRSMGIEDFFALLGERVLFPDGIASYELYPALAITRALKDRIVAEDAA